MNRIGKAVLWALGLSIYTVAVMGWLFWPSRREVYRSTQPSSVHYDAADPYVLSVIEGPVEYLELGWPHRHSIRVSRRGDDYGHYIPVRNDRIARVDWRPEGLSVTFETAHRLFIPNAAFVSGR